MKVSSNTAIVLSVIIIFTGSLLPAYSQDLLPELVRRIKPSAVAIETFDAHGEKLSRGSGFFIDTDRIVTNRHVIEGAYRAEVHSSTGNVYPVKGVLAVDAEGDIALLKIDAPAAAVRPLRLDRTSPQEGESIVVIGNPLGLEGSVTNGIVSAVRDIPTFGRIIQITAPISSGSSGSPVVNMQGQVIGIATLQVTGGQSVNFAIPSERISQLQQTSSLMSLSDLVVASGRNKRAKAVQFFRDGLSFLSKDDCEKALSYFAKAVESDSNYAEAWAQSGFCNEKLGKHVEAIEASRKAVTKQAIRLRPDYTSAYERLGARYLRSRKFPEAIEVFRQITVLKPGDAVAPNNMGEAYLELNRLNEALEAFRQSIRLKPDFGRAYYNLGKCLLAMGNRDGALDQYNILTNIDPDWAEKLNGLINP